MEFLLKWYVSDLCEIVSCVSFLNDVDHPPSRKSLSENAARSKLTAIVPNPTFHWLLSCTGGGGPYKHEWFSISWLKTYQNIKMVTYLYSNWKWSKSLLTCNKCASKHVLASSYNSHSAIRHLCYHLWYSKIRLYSYRVN
jgi:hypothetical protein